MYISRYYTFIGLIWALLVSPALMGQTVDTPPKLVVGVVVDQMRFDQLYKYRSRYGQDGFNRLLREGFNFKNTNYNYVPTLTAPGHASIATGAPPSVHGIIGNSWFDRSLGRVVSNVEDSTATQVGTQLPSPYGLSPRRLLATTISDQLRMATNYRAKVISVSLKDRGAILPGGHTANAAFWHDWETSPGHFVSSSYYMEELPQWVQRFNQQEKSNAYLDQTWNTLYPIATYTASAADDNPYERAIGGKGQPTFPYDFKKLRERYRELGAEYQLLWLSPYGNSLLTEFALEALKQEGLGEDATTDILWISYTVTDVIGHTLGSQAVEMEDIFLRLDQNIADLLSALDQKVGKGNYLLFLTSDHGAIPTASYLKQQQVPTGLVPVGRYKMALANYLNQKYGAYAWIQHFDYEQLYLDRALIAERKLHLPDVQQEAASFLMGLEGVADASTAYQLQTMAYGEGRRNLVQRGYNAKRSGDVLLTFEPGVVYDPGTNLTIDRVKGSSHGTGYAYDTHVPMLWFGSGIPKGSSVRQVTATDIAPTLALFLDIQYPNGSMGQPLGELFDNK